MSGVKSVSCPYNPAHIMPQISLAGHLSKCTFRSPNFDSCRYNVMHIMPKVDIADHQKKCPDKDKKKQEDDDWGFTEEVRENMRKEIEMERKKRRQQKKKQKSMLPEDKEPEKQQDDFQEPDFSKIDSKNRNNQPLNLTQASIVSDVASTTSKKTKKPKIDEF